MTDAYQEKVKRLVTADRVEEIWQQRRAKEIRRYPDREVCTHGGVIVYRMNGLDSEDILLRKLQARVPSPGIPFGGCEVTPP